MLTEKPCLRDYAKHEENLVTTEASKTGLGNIHWQKQDKGDIKPIAFGSKYLNHTKKQFHRRTRTIYWQ